MKLIRHITDLNKAINKENELGFIPTMGSLHKGHEYLINQSKKLCKKTLVSIFVNPTQFNNMKDYKTYPRDLIKDLKILKKLKVNFVYLPTTKQIYRKKRPYKIIIPKSQKILCAKFRIGHFKGVLDVIDRFISLIKPNYIFLGEKDFQQLFLIKKLIKKKYKTKVISIKTIRDKNSVALSTRNALLSKKKLQIASFIAKKLINMKNKIKKDNKIINFLKKEFTNKFNIKIEYLEIRNENNLRTYQNSKKFRIFIAYYLAGIRLIDNF